MTVCSHTGITVPECSCSACIQAQIERHMPSLLAGSEGELTMEPDGTVVAGRFPRFRLASRLRSRKRRLRRAA